MFTLLPVIASSPPLLLKRTGDRTGPETMPPKVLDNGPVAPLIVPPLRLSEPPLVSIAPFETERQSSPRD